MSVRAGRRLTMGEVVNLNKHRKRKERAQRTSQADANRVKFGRNKDQKTREADEARRSAEAHELLRFERAPKAPSDEEQGR